MVPKNLEVQNYHQNFTQFISGLQKCNFCVTVKSLWSVYGVHADLYGVSKSSMECSMECAQISMECNRMSMECNKVLYGVSNYPMECHDHVSLLNK